MKRAIGICVATLGALTLAAVPAVAPAQQATGATLQLTLEQAVAMALLQNRSLRLRGENVAHYEALKAKQRAGYFPTISNSSHASYLTDLEGVVIPAGSFGTPAATGAIPAQTLRLDQGAQQSFGVGTHLVQPTTELFAIHAMNRAAQADLDTARLQVEDGEASLAISVRQVFSQLQIIAKETEAAEAAEQAARETLRESQANQREGSSLSVNDLNYQAELLEDQSSTLKLKLALHKSSLQLADLLGAPLDTRFVLLDSLPAPPTLPTREQARELALKAEPSVQMAEQAVEKARAELRAAEDAYIPGINAAASQEYQSGVPFLVHNFGTFEVKFTWNLFDGGAREAKLRDARAGVRSAEIALDQARDDAAITVEQAYDDVEQAAQGVSLAQQTVKVRTEALRLAQANVDQGDALLSSRDSARAELLSAQAGAVEAALDLTLASSEVLRALGRIAR